MAHDTSRPTTGDGSSSCFSLDLCARGTSNLQSSPTRQCAGRICTLAPIEPGVRPRPGRCPASPRAGGTGGHQAWRRCWLKELADIVLPALPSLDIVEPGLFVLLDAGDEAGETALRFQPHDALGGRLEVQPQRALDRNLVEAEVGVVEDLADHPQFLHRQLGDRVLFAEGYRFTFGEAAEQSCDIGDLVGLTLAVGWVAQFVALVAKALGHLDEEASPIDEVDLIRRCLPKCRRHTEWQVCQLPLWQLADFLLQLWTVSRRRPFQDALLCNCALAIFATCSAKL